MNIESSRPMSGDANRVPQKFGVYDQYAHLPVAKQRRQVGLPTMFLLMLVAVLAAFVVADRVAAGEDFAPTPVDRVDGDLLPGVEGLGKVEIVNNVSAPEPTPVAPATTRPPATSMSTTSTVAATTTTTNDVPRLLVEPEDAGSWRDAQPADQSGRQSQEAINQIIAACTSNLVIADDGRVSCSNGVQA